LYLHSLLADPEFERYYIGLDFGVIFDGDNSKLFGIEFCQYPPWLYHYNYQLELSMYLIMEIRMFWSLGLPFSIGQFNEMFFFTNFNKNSEIPSLPKSLTKYPYRPIQIIILLIIMLFDGCRSLILFIRHIMMRNNIA
jgi:hypothetical protein